MIKKIQHYLLTHHPLLWNIRLLPTLLVTAGLNLLFFIIGYIQTDTSFGHSYYSSIANKFGLLYFASILVGILILIGWLILYMRNNALKSYYPRKISHVYFEWFLIFVITSSMAFIPYTLTLGGIAKWNSVGSLNEAERGLELVNKVNILIPNNNDSSYKYDEKYSKPLAIPADTKLILDSINTSLYLFEYNKKQMIVKGYIGPSLLFYNSFNYYYARQYEIDKNDNSMKDCQDIEEVKSWLIHGEEEKIKALMSEYLLLSKKYNITNELTVDEWYERIYQPPFFPVNRQTTILRNYNNSYYENNEYANNYNLTLPRLSTDLLESGFEEVIHSHKYTKEYSWIILVCLLTSIFISSLIFSWRITRGRNWLIAFITVGVLLFASCLFSVFISEVMMMRGDSFQYSMLFLWTALFITLSIYIINKVVRKKNKGWSNTLINIFIWMIPMSFPLLYSCLYNMTYNYYYQFTEWILWLNIPITILLMAVASRIIRLWKSLPDE